MKKIATLLLLLSISACNQPETKSKINVEYEGEQIDALKSLITSFTEGDWETYRSHFKSDATVAHNVWYQNEGASISIDEMLTQHKWNRENIFSSLSVNEGIYEIITQEKGGQFGHVWIEFTTKGYNSDEEVKIPVYLSFLMDQNKVSFEWAFYDTSSFPEPKIN
jgi:hypothetical protein